MRRVRTDFAPASNAAVITPMLDMSFQILAFFIMTYHPSALEGHVQGQLATPRAEAVVKPIDDPLPPSDVPEPGDALTIVVRAVPRGQLERQRSDGQPTQILVQTPEDVVPALAADADEPLDASLSKLFAQLTRRAVRERGAVRLECAGDLKHQYVMRVYDVCRRAGYGAVSFVAPRPAKA